MGSDSGTKLLTARVAVSQHEQITSTKDHVPRRIETDQGHRVSVVLKIMIDGIKGSMNEDKEEAASIRTASALIVVKATTSF